MTTASPPPFTGRDLAAALFVVLVWGTNFIAMKIGLRSLTPFQLGAGRYLFAVLPLVLLVRPPKMAAKWLLLYGLCQGVGQFGLLFLSLQVGGAGVGAAADAGLLHGVFRRRAAGRKNRRRVAGRPGAGRAGTGLLRRRLSGRERRRHHGRRLRAVPGRRSDVGRLEYRGAPYPARDAAIRRDPFHGLELSDAHRPLHAAVAGLRRARNALAVAGRAVDHVGGAGLSGLDGDHPRLRDVDRPAQAPSRQPRRALQPGRAGGGRDGRYAVSE